MRAGEYIDYLASRGRHQFTTAAAIEAIGGSESAVRAQIRRLNRKGRIASPLRSFHVIVPPKYRRLGCLPATHLVDHLMQYLDIPYYAALLSAAERYSEVHQRPPALQAVVPANRPDIKCGSERITFVARSDMERMPVVTFNTPNGYIKYSTPEVTALELVGYMKHAGGLSNVMEVLAKLVEAITPQKLLEVAELCPVGWSQRLGYLLEVVERADIATALYPFVKDSANNYIPLRRYLRDRGGKRVERWKVIHNAKVEKDV